MLYVGRTYTARLSASVTKGVHCENCGCDYLYQLHRTAEGKGSSPYYLDNQGASNRAAAAAQRSLTRALNDCDLAPCPECGWYQPEMVKKMQGRYSWILTCAIFPGLIGGFALFGGFSAFLLYCLSIFGFLYALWWILHSGCKPNFRAAERVGKTIPGAPRIIACADVPALFAEGKIHEEVKQNMIEAMIKLDERKKSQPEKVIAPMDPMAQESAELERRGTVHVRVISLFAGAAVVFWAIGPISSWVYEARAYQAMVNSPKTDVTAGLRFIAAYPQSSHRAEAEEISDDRSYTQALATAKIQNSTQPLLQYLSSNYAKKHRAEATAASKEIYVEALKRLQALTEKGKADADLSRGLFALLNSLADSDRPTVTVGFNPTCEALPQDLLAITSENESLKVLKAESPELVTFIQSNPNPVLAPGKAFDADQMARRENVILERLKNSIYKGSGSTVMNFTRVSPRAKTAAAEKPDATAKPVDPPMIQINYHVYPLGALSVWTETPQPGNPRQRGKQPANAQGERIRGMVRHYSVDWDIVIRPKGSTEAYTLKLESHSQPDFRFDTRPTDPDWALYSILMQSAAYDFANELIRKFGMEPPPLPTYYTMDGAVQ